MCIDHPEVQALIGRVRDRRIITYGAQPAGGCAPRRCRTYANGETRFTVRVTRPAQRQRSHEIDGLTLQMPGDHNALNATAAIAVARELGISDENIRQGLQELHWGQAPLHPHRRA